MSFKLGPDGKPVEVKTSFGKGSSEQTYDPTMPPKRPPPQYTEPATQPPKKVDLFSHVSQEPPTQPAPRPKPQTPPVTSAAEEPKTQLVGATGVGTAVQWVCGWLVVVDGPGKGNSLVVGPGQSAISRSPTERIVLNFGDATITSKQQLLVIYDDEYREFLVAPGNGANLNRLNGQVIAGPMPLRSGDIVRVGATTLRFMAFCDSNFAW